MAIGNHKEHAAESMDTLLKMRTERSDTTCKHIDDRMLNPVLLDIAARIVESSYVVPDCLRRADIRHLDFKAVRGVVFKLSVLTCLACHVVFDALIAFMATSQPINKGLVATVLARDTL